MSYVAVPTDLPEFGITYPMDARHAHLGLGFTNPDLCWFLGLYLGDGFLKHNDPYVSVQIAIDPTDEGLISEICRVGYEQFGLDFTVGSDGLTADSSRYGGTGRIRRAQWSRRCQSHQARARVGVRFADGSAVGLLGRVH